MVTKTNINIAEAAKLGDCYLRWFGNLKKRSWGDPTTFISAFFSPVVFSKDQSRIIHWDKDPNRISRIDIPIAYIPELYVHRVLRNGDLMPSSEGLIPPALQKEEFTFECGFSNIADRNDPIVVRYMKFANGLGDFNVILQMTNNGIVLLPCFELFRVLHCRTSRLANSMFNGDLLSIYARIFDPAHSSIDPITLEAHIKLRCGMSGDEAPFVAHYIDKPELIENAIETYLYAIRMHDMKSGEAPLTCDWPYEKATLTANFINIGDAKLITRILQINSHVSFTSVHWNLDNDGRSGNPLLPLLRKGQRTRHPRNSPLHQKLSNNPAGPNPAVINVAQMDSEPIFPFLKNVPCERTEKTINPTQAPLLPPQTVLIGPTGTSSQSSSHLSKFHRAYITATKGVAPPSGPVSPDQYDARIGSAKYEKTLTTLENMHIGGQKVECEFVRATLESGHHGSRAFNLISPDSRRSRQKDWLYTVPDKLIRRMVFVARLTYGNQIRYAVEFQNKHDGEISMLIVWAPDFSEIHIPTWELVFLDCLRNGCATISDARQLVCWNRVMHTELFNKPARLSKKIFECVSM